MLEILELVTYLYYNINMTEQGPSEDSSTWTSGLDERKSKYCHCVLKVAAKQSPECLQGVTKRKGITSGCYNPYPVCAKSTGTSTGRSGCSDYYNFMYIPDQYLRAYLDLHSAPYPKNASRDQLIDAIKNFKKVKYGK